MKFQRNAVRTAGEREGNDGSYTGYYYPANQTLHYICAYKLAINDRYKAAVNVGAYCT